MASNYKINTPHAAVIIWNYDDRVSSDGVKNLDGVNQVLISTLSCISINTNKTKSNPQGSFQLVLAPMKNWVSTITPGSWCVLLMSNKPIDAKDLKKADPQKVKMVGKIESVRVETSMGEDGARRTQYMVTGVDWGYIFNNIIYIDNNIGAANDPKTQGQGVAIAIQKALFGANGVPKAFDTASNLRSIINIFGQNLKGFTQQGNDINRLAKSAYDFRIPKEMVDYFHFIGPTASSSKSQQLNKILTLFHGSLVGPDKYSNKSESIGFINSFSLQGTHSYWQVLLENSNPALNEMLCDLKWEKNGVRLALYNRIRPFSFKGFNPSAGSANHLKSYFQYLKTTLIDDVDIISVNAGTNWRDKYNFIEIKPQIQDFEIFANWYKQKVQVSDPKAFQREGFRPLIVETKQFPGGGNSVTGYANFDALSSWTKLMKEWYFDTHRMLNGTIIMVGQNNYIGVGENIKFNADLVNPTPNMNSTAFKNKSNAYILGHVESVSHSFTVKPDGARTYITTVQFVRGILVDGSNVNIGKGTLDQFADSLQPADQRNSKNTLSTSDELDPDPQKVRGT